VQGGALIEKLTAVCDELRGEYLRGLSGSRRDALFAALLHINPISVG
jgi:hypothetical protein